MKVGDVCIHYNYELMRDCDLVRLASRLPRDPCDHFTAWRVVDLKTGATLITVFEDALSDPLNAMEVLAWMAK